MVDNLTDEERVLAWKSNWNPSFAGMAILEKNGTFRSANPQFCELLGVTPAELIGSRFQDITPPDIQQLEERNAQLVVDGAIDFYVLPKRFYFSNGREVEVVLLVSRCPSSAEGEFQFFLARIMLNEDGDMMKAHQARMTDIDLNSSYPRLINTVEGLLKHPILKYWIILGVMLGGFFAGILLDLVSKF